jgi:hypothetical protein
MEFKAAELEQPLRLTERFDLTICVEVAEHLSAGRAESFVQDLCTTSDVVLFSAAIPRQGGVSHINEEWQSVWAARFERAGYDAFDLFRPIVWDCEEVERWYRQNVLLYLRRAHPLASRLRERGSAGLPLNLVHPQIYLGNLETYQMPLEEPTLGFCTRLFGRWLGRTWHRFTGRRPAPQVQPAAASTLSHT